MRRIALVALAATLAGCARSSTGLSSTDISGTWSGTVSSSLASGTVRATLGQSGSSFSGTWGITYPNSTYNDAGQLTGRVNGSNVSFTATPSVPTDCSVTANLTMSGTTMSGTFATFNCTAAQTGSINITKQ